MDLMVYEMYLIICDTFYSMKQNRIESRLIFRIEHVSIGVLQQKVDT